MRLHDLVLNQAELLTGKLEAESRELLRLQCNGAVSILTNQLRIDPEQCREEFVAAACLYALSDWYQGKPGEDFQEFRAGDLTVKPGARSAGNPQSLKQQALAILRPYLKDGFRFMGV